MSKIITIATALVLAGGMWAHAEIPPKADFYVAATGNDANDGSAQKPFASLARAREAVRALVRKGLTKDVTVLIHGGTYHLKEPLIFDPQDSGTGEHTITYAAYPGEKPVISGGRHITGWKKGEQNRWTATLPEAKAGKWRFRQVFADGKRLPRARFPNAGTRLTVESVSKDVKTIRFKQPLVGADLAGKNAELVMYQNWSVSRAAINASDKNSVTTKTPVGWIGHGNATTASPGKPAYLEHASEFLDQPTEWYLEGKSGVLTYVAAPGENPNNRRFVAPVLEQLLVIAGRPEAPVRNIVFKGLTFEHTAWQLPAFGYSGIQAGHHGTTMAERTYVLPVAIQFSYTHGCMLNRCRVAHTGAGGVGFGAGCRHNKITGCQIVDIGANGVMVGWRGNGPDSPLVNGQGDPSLAADWKDPKQVPVANEVFNNIIHRCGTIHHGAVGVYDAFCRNTKISHNLVKNLPYTGISVGFRWDTSSTSQRGCVIEYNHIHDVMKVLADGGGIYTLGLQPDTVLRGNLIHDVHRSSLAHGGAPNNGIFFDQGSKGYRVEGNIIYRTSGKPIRFNQTNKANLTWKNNSFGPEPGSAKFPEDAARRLLDQRLELPSASRPVDSLQK